jgi:hypothetical protein
MRSIMRRILLAAAALSAVLLFTGRPALALYGSAPWCAVLDTGSGSVQWECIYGSIESCRPNILAGNRGFCNPNPYYRAREKRHVRRHHARRHHYRN